MAASIWRVRGGSLISVSEPPRNGRDGQRKYSKIEEERGLLYSSREPVLMAQGFYEGFKDWGVSGCLTHMQNRKILTLTVLDLKL